MGTLKLLGALLVIVAGALIGFRQARLLAGRPKQIRQLISAMQRLETEISYGFTPLPEALQHIGGQLANPLSRLFTRSGGLLDEESGLTARESWHQAIHECWAATAMKQSEKEIVLQLGYSLGISDREDQIKHIRLIMSQLEAEEENAREEQKRYEKMWKSLGVLGGALVVILMY